MIIIGITGTLGAGKGTIVDYLVKEKGFVRKEHAENLIVSDDPKDLLAKMEQFQPTDVKKWVVEIKEQVKR